MSPSAIPTKYAGTEFRSRLEARWAAFFDLVGWRWEYEPIDLPGWIPDFMLTGHTNVLVEIKPADSIDGFDLDKLHRATENDTFNHEILLLGRHPMLIQRTHAFGQIGIGWLYGYSTWWPDTIADPHEAMWITHTGDRSRETRLDFCSDTHDYTGRLTGAHQENGGVELGPSRSDLVEYLWREAGNITRWNRPTVPGLTSSTRIGDDRDTRELQEAKIREAESIGDHERAERLRSHFAVRSRFTQRTPHR